MAYRIINGRINNNAPGYANTILPIATGASSGVGTYFSLKNKANNFIKSRNIKISSDYSKLSNKYPYMLNTKKEYQAMRKGKFTDSRLNTAGSVISLVVAAIPALVSVLGTIRNASKFEAKAAKDLVKMVHQGDLDISDLMAYAKDVDNKRDARIIVNALKQLGYEGQPSAQFIGNTRKKYKKQIERRKW